MVATVKVIFEASKWATGKRKIGEQVKQRMNIVMNRMKNRAARAATRRLTTTGQSSGLDTYTPRPQHYISKLFITPATRTSGTDYNYNALLGNTHRWAEAIEKGTSPHMIAPKFMPFLVFWTRAGQKIVTRFPVMHPGGRPKFIIRDSVKNFQRDMRRQMKGIEAEM